MIQASREQVRAVEGEELWTPSLDDVKALKDTEIDLSRKHALAFDHRGPAPTALSDQRVLDTLDAQGQPQALIDVPAILVPVPAAAPTEERATSSGSSLASPPTPVTYLPPTPVPAGGQVPAPTTPALPPVPEDKEQTFDDEPKRIETKSSTQSEESQLKLQDAAPAILDRQQSASTSEPMAMVSPRGTKREAEQDADALRGDGSRATPAQTTGAGATVSPIPDQALLIYCKDCGTSAQEASPTTFRCERCHGTEAVEDPRQVDSWLDESHEYDAMEKLSMFHYHPFYKRWIDKSVNNDNFTLDLPRDADIPDAMEAEMFLTGIGQIHRELPEYVTNDTTTAWSTATLNEEDGKWHWHQTFGFRHPEYEAEQFPNAPKNVIHLEHNLSAQRQIREADRQPEKRFLKRCGRHCAHLTGWDGSPSELHPAFLEDNYMLVYNLLCHEVANDLVHVDEDTLVDIQFDVEHFGEQKLADVMWVDHADQPSVFHAGAGADQVMVMGESSDEDDDGESTSGRAAKQALKRELPWRAISASDRPGFLVALREEWSEWEKWSSCKLRWLREGEVDPSLILRSRVAYRWKPKDGGQWYKPKARIVVLGFADPHLPLLARDSPVLSRIGFMLILQWAASHQVSLYNADCKSAFLQGLPDTERPEPIYMRPPQDDLSLEMMPEWRIKNMVYMLTAPVYGQANAPRRWFMYVVDVVTKKRKWRQHTLDPCCFMFEYDSRIVALLGLHVDDIICCCLDGYMWVLDEIKQSFSWGSEWECDDFIFVGRRIRRQEDGGFTLDQVHYVSDIMKTKVTMDPEEPLHQHPELVTEFRSGIGSLQWLAGTTRGDLSSYVSLLQKKHSDLKVSDLIEINRVLRYVKATSTAFVKVNSIPLDDAVFVAYGDSGFANAPNNKSQGGYVITLTSKQALAGSSKASLLDWKSYRHQRMLRSTLAAEASSLDRAQDTGNFMGCMFSEMLDPTYRATCGMPAMEIIPITDARSLFDAVHRISTNFAEKRVEIDVAGLRSTCRNLRWVPSELQHADAMTKMSTKLRDSFRQWMSAPTVTLAESRSAAEINGSANEPWRVDKREGKHSQQKVGSVTIQESVSALACASQVLSRGQPITPEANR